jgi:hypothetical protein
MKNLIKTNPLLIVLMFWLMMLMIFSTGCTSSRSTYGNSGSHGWGTESRCGKKKPGKWQRTSSRETNRNGDVECHTWW